MPTGLDYIQKFSWLYYQNEYGEEQFKNITATTNPVPVKKGDRIGCFKYGGSLNILLFEKDRFPSLNILQGQQIGLLLSESDSALKLTRTKLNRFLNRIAYLAK